MSTELPKIVIELGELDYPEVTGLKLVRMLRRQGSYQVIIEIPGHRPGMITSGSKHDGTL